MLKDPDMTKGEVAGHFGITRVTLKKPYPKLRAHLDIPKIKARRTYGNNSYIPIGEC